MASYPSATKSFTTKIDGAGHTILSAHVNDLQDEVVAVENGLIGGLAHDLIFTDATFDIGKTGATRPRDLFLSRDVTVGRNETVAGTLDVTGATTVAALTASGTLTPLGLLDASGASAGQLKFPAAQNASANANTLDDYEEGPWTPTGNGVTLTVTSARYTKIGRLVHVTADVTWPATANGSQAQIASLPFTVGVDSAATVGYHTSGAVFTALMQTTAIYLFTNSGVAVSNATMTTAILRVSGTYTV